MIAAGMTLPRTSGASHHLVQPMYQVLNFLTEYSLLYYFLLWFTVFAAALAFIFAHGIQYVAWPKLNPLTDIIYYDGAGFRSAHHGKGLQATEHLDFRKNKWVRATKPIRHAVEELELGTLKKHVD